MTAISCRRQIVHRGVAGYEPLPLRLDLWLHRGQGCRLHTDRRRSRYHDRCSVLDIRCSMNYTEPCYSDLLIIGGGPAGLSAAINAASEGLVVRLLDNNLSLGGQARESNAIENYPGFPESITGNDLMHSMVLQAIKFKTVLLCPVNAIFMERDEVNNRVVVTTADYQVFRSKAVLIAIGLNYRRLDATNISNLMGRGVYYGTPPGILPGHDDHVCQVAIIGGANSAGQAAIKLAETANVEITMYIRKTIEHQMSRYLVDRIKSTPNITLCEGCTVTTVHGEKWLTNVTVKQGDDETTPATDYMFIFIGAQPMTAWLRNTISLDADHYIQTGGNMMIGTRPAMHYETSMQGVFAAGDVRAYSTKRIAAAIGEGSAVMQSIHRYLAAYEDG